MTLQVSKRAINMTVNIEKEVKKSRKGNLIYSSNPFLADAAINTKTGVKRISSKGGEQMMVISQNTGEVIAPAGFWHAQEVDKSQFVKLYINGVKAFKELSGAGTKVFEVLYLAVQEAISKDTIYINFLSLDQAITPMSESTFHRGMKELIEKSFLAESQLGGWYFINPDFLWNGDRLTFVKEFRMKTEKSPRDQVAREELEAKGQQRLMQ